MNSQNSTAGRSRIDTSGRRHGSTLVIAGLLLTWTSIATAQEPRTKRVTVSSAGVPANVWNNRPAISDDGAVVAFTSFATNLVPNDTDQFGDVYVRDRVTSLTELVSVSTSGVKGNESSNIAERAVSATGRFVAFASLADNLVAGDTNGVRDVLLRDRQTNETFLVSVGTGGIQADKQSFIGSVSFDGRYVAFRCDADNIDPSDTNGAPDIYVHDRQTQTTVRASVASGGAQSIGLATQCSISSNGRFVVFQSNAPDLVPGDTNNSVDVFVHDLENKTTERISLNWLGFQVSGPSTEATISADGRYVAFQSIAGTLIPGDVNGEDIFVRDRVAGTLTLVSVNSQGVQANGDCYWPSISPEGRQVAFTSLASNLVPGNGGWDCYVHDLDTGETRAVSVDGAGNPGKGISVRPATATLARVVAFNSSSNDLVPGPAFNHPHNYVHTLEGCPFPVVYCQPSSTSLPGCSMGLTFTHAPQVSLPDAFTIRTFAPGGNLAIGLVGISGPASLPLGTLGGAICVQPPFVRLPPRNGGGVPAACNGLYQYTLADIAAATPFVVAGSELFVQIWSRDPNNVDGFALSDAGRITVCP